jgi:3-polyprenyl-4-hydroxybenzoate decarboxylase
MATETLRDFVEFLDREGELARVRAKVNPALESRDRRPDEQVARARTAQELDRNPAASLGGRGLLFENVEGSDTPRRDQHVRQLLARPTRRWGRRTSKPSPHGCSSS